MLVCLIGKGASGKDTLYKKLREDRVFSFVPLIPYTTRPKRDGELHGSDYYFVSEEEMRRLSEENKIFESRSYQVDTGIWHYFTCVEGVTVICKNIITVCTPDVYEKFCNYFGDENVIGIQLEVSRQERERRMLMRELQQPKEKRNFREVTRRLEADDNAYIFDEIKYRHKNLYKLLAETITAEELHEIVYNLLSDLLLFDSESCESYLLDSPLNSVFSVKAKNEGGNTFEMQI